MRIKFKKASLATKLVIMILLVYAMVTIVFLQRQISEKQREREALELQITQVQQANADLSEDIAALGTREGIEAVAREKLGLVSEGEITFFDVGD